MSAEPSFDPREVLERARPVPVGRGPSTTPVSALSGVDLGGRALEIPLDDRAGPWTVLLFLSPSCDGCGKLWELVRTGSIDGARVVAVVRPGDLRGTEDLEALHRSAGEGTVVVSDGAWSAYGVLGGPFHVVVDPERATVVSEGVTIGTAQLRADLGRAAAGSP